MLYAVCAVLGMLHLSLELRPARDRTQYSTYPPPQGQSHGEGHCVPSGMPWMSAWSSTQRPEQVAVIQFTHGLLSAAISGRHGGHNRDHPG